MSEQAKIPAGAGSEPKRRIGVLGWFAIAFGMFVLFNVVSCTQQMAAGEDEPEEFVPTQTDARFVCEEWVKERLKAPATAEFTDGTVSGSPSGYTITGTVDSENGFGAMLRGDWSCEIRYEPSTEEWRGSATVS